jgi:3-isopropylmalate dehydrogenase
MKNRHGKKIAVILGDGIGPEVTQQAIKVLNAVAQRFGHVFQYTEGIMGADAIDKTGNPLPDETIRNLHGKRCDFVWRNRPSQI